MGKTPDAQCGGSWLSPPDHARRDARRAVSRPRPSPGSARSRRPSRVTRCTVLLSPPMTPRSGRHVVGDDQVAALPGELRPGVARSRSRSRPRSRRRAAGRPSLRCATVARMSGFSVSASAGSAPPFFLIFCVARIGDAPIGDGGGEDGDIGRQRLPRPPPASRARSRHARSSTPAGSGRSTGPGDQRHLGAGLRRRPRDGVALLAGGAVGDVAHRIDRLVRRPGGDEHVLAGERTARRRQQALDGRRRSPAARPCGRARSRPRPWRRRWGRRRATPSACRVSRLRCVAGCCHMRTFIAGAIRIGRVVASSTVEARSSAWPPAILAMRLAVAGATTTRSASRASRIWPISASSSRSNRSVWLRSPESAEAASGVTNCCAPAVRMQRTRGAALAQAADEVERLVGGDAAADDEEDAFARQRHRQKPPNAHDHQRRRAMIHKAAVLQRLPRASARPMAATLSRCERDALRAVMSSSLAEHALGPQAPGRAGRRRAPASVHRPRPASSMRPIGPEIALDPVAHHGLGGGPHVELRVEVAGHALDHHHGLLQHDELGAGRHVEQRRDLEQQRQQLRHRDLVGAAVVDRLADGADRLREILDRMMRRHVAGLEMHLRRRAGSRGG